MDKKPFAGQALNMKSNAIYIASSQFGLPSTLHKKINGGEIK